MTIPPCANWNIWLGPEVEGQDNEALGKKTLFVRQGDPYPYVTKTGSRFNPSIVRIWFCKEFKDMVVVQDLANFFPVTLEVSLSTWYLLKKSVMENERITLFFKLPISLRQGDHICVGPAFSDESFKIGTGSKVSVQDYLKDRRLE